MKQQLQPPERCIFIKLELLYPTLSVPLFADATTIENTTRILFQDMDKV
jgi:hypothetical protein